MLKQLIERVRGWAAARTAAARAPFKIETLAHTVKGQFVPPVGAVITMGGFKYRVRKVTDKDVILRPVGNK